MISPEALEAQKLYARRIQRRTERRGIETLLSAAEKAQIEGLTDDIRETEISNAMTMWAEREFTRGSRNRRGRNDIQVQYEHIMNDT